MCKNKMNTNEILCQKGLYRDVINIIDEHLHGDKDYWKERMTKCINDCVSIAENIPGYTTCFCEDQYVYCEECDENYCFQSIKKYTDAFNTPTYQYIKKKASDAIRDSDIKSWAIDDHSILMYHLYDSDEDTEDEEDYFRYLHDRRLDKDVKKYFPDMPPIDRKKTIEFLQETEYRLDLDKIRARYINIEDQEDEVLKILLIYYIVRYDLYEYMWDDPQ